MGCTTGAWGSDFRQKQEIYISVPCWGPCILLLGRQGRNCDLRLGPGTELRLAPLHSSFKNSDFFLSLIILKIRNM